MMTCGTLEQSLSTSTTTGLETARRWFVVQTRSRHEKSVHSAASRLCLEAFLPLRRESRCWSDRRKLVDFPLFPGYVFIHCTTDERFQTFQIPGIVGYVCANSQPIPIPEQEVEAIREVLSRGVLFEPYLRLESGQKVKVIAGPLKGITGTFESNSRNGKLVLAIHALGRGISVQIDGADVTPDA